MITTIKQKPNGESYISFEAGVLASVGLDTGDAVEWFTDGNTASFSRFAGMNVALNVCNEMDMRFRVCCDAETVEVVVQDETYRFCEDMSVSKFIRFVDELNEMVRRLNNVSVIEEIENDA